MGIIRYLGAFCVVRCFVILLRNRLVVGSSRLSGFFMGLFLVGRRNWIVGLGGVGRRRWLELFD